MGDSSGPAFRPAILVEVEKAGAFAEIRVTDNGIGLAKNSVSSAPGAKLGRGYGLVNVRNYAESHGGSFELVDASAAKTRDHAGATACIRLPIKREKRRISEPRQFPARGFRVVQKERRDRRKGLKGT